MPEGKRKYILRCSAFFVWNVSQPGGTSRDPSFPLLVPDPKLAGPASHYARVTHQRVSKKSTTELVFSIVATMHNGGSKNKIFKQGMWFYFCYFCFLRGFVRNTHHTGDGDDDVGR